MLEELYKKANEIENVTKSPRLIKLHEEGKYCPISLGTFYQETTKYMFVSLNPGYEEPETAQMTPQEAVAKSKSLKEYLSVYKFSYAQKLNKIIKSFANEKGITVDETILLFGTTDCSFFHSKTAYELEESFYIEVKECLPVLLAELSIRNLDTIIFSGVPQLYFFYNLYKPGSSIIKYGVNSPVGKHDKLIACNTTLINDRTYDVCFMPHLSGTWGWKDAELDSIGQQLAKGFIQQSNLVLDNSNVII